METDVTEEILCRKLLAAEWVATTDVLVNFY